MFALRFSTREESTESVLFLVVGNLEEDRSGEEELRFPMLDGEEPVPGASMMV